MAKKKLAAIQKPDLPAPLSRPASVSCTDLLSIGHDHNGGGRLCSLLARPGSPGAACAVVRKAGSTPLFLPFPFNGVRQWELFGRLFFVVVFFLNQYSRLFISYIYICLLQLDNKKRFICENLWGPMCFFFGFFFLARHLYSGHVKYDYGFINVAICHRPKKKIPEKKNTEKMAGRRCTKWFPTFARRQTQSGVQITAHLKYKIILMAIFMCDAHAICARNHLPKCNHEN